MIKIQSEIMKYIFNYTLQLIRDMELIDKKMDKELQERIRKEKAKQTKSSGQLAFVFIPFVFTGQWYQYIL